MVNEKEVVVAAQRLYQEKDEVGLELLLGMRDKAIEKNSALGDDPNFEPKYEGPIMGTIDEIKDLGKRILARWNKELYGLVCGAGGADKEERKAVFDSLNLGEAAVVAAIAGALLSIGAPAAVAAVAAPLVVKRFVWPAKDELCAAWGEQIQAHS